jgi:hypothetical protein
LEALRDSAELSRLTSLPSSCTELLAGPGQSDTAPALSTAPLAAPFAREPAHLARRSAQLGEDLMAAGDLAAASPLLQHALKLRLDLLEQQHAAVADLLLRLARVYRERLNFAEAERYLGRSLAIREQVLGKDHPAIGQALSELAELYRLQGERAEAEKCLKRSRQIRQKR